jgi:hypothetical protein
MSLRGFRLTNGDYMPLVGTRLQSKVLGLDLRLELRRNGNSKKNGKN